MYSKTYKEHGRAQSVRFTMRRIENFKFECARIIRIMRAGKTWATRGLAVRNIFYTKEEEKEGK